MSQRSAREAWAFVLPIGAVIAAMAAFQIGAAFAKNLFPAIGPQGAAALRLVFGAAILLAVMRPWRAWPAHAPVVSMLGLGVAMAGAIQFFYLAIDHLPLGIAIAIQFLGPLAIAIFGSRQAIDLVWAALAAVGVWCLVATNSTGAAIDPTGIAYALGAAVCWASYIILGRKTTAVFGNSTAAIAVSIAAVVILPLGIARAGVSLLSPDVLPLGLLVALFSAAIPFSLEFFAMPRLPARTFAVFMSLEPTFGVLFGFLILHEQLTLFQITGIALVVIAAVGAAWSSASRKPSGARIDAAEAPPT